MTDFGSLSERTIKVTHDGEIYRGKLSVDVGATSCQAFSAIQSTVSALVGISAEHLWLKYEDEEGDLCTLTDISMEDFVALNAAGVLRLSLQVRDNPMQEPSKEECTHSSSTNVDETTSDLNTNAADGSEADNALRSRLRKFLQKFPAVLSGVALGVVQHMDPSVLHGLLEKIKEQKAAAMEQPPFNIAGEDAHMVEEMIPEMLSMEPYALKALIIEELQRISPANNGASTAGAQPQQDPFSAMLGALLGGNPSQPNPFGQLMNAMVAGKGSGKGAPPATPQPNPLGHLINAMVAAKGSGKGAPPQCAPGMQGANPWESMLQGCFPQHISGGFQGAENPTGSCFAQNSSGSCAGWSAEKMQGGSDTDTTHSSNLQVDAPPASIADPASRTVFEDSVEDLVNMGLVSDRQVARELLTKHGDISTVVSILTDGA